MHDGLVSLTVKEEIYWLITCKMKNVVFLFVTLYYIDNTLSQHTMHGSITQQCCCIVCIHTYIYNFVCVMCGFCKYMIMPNWYRYTQYVAAILIINILCMLNDLSLHLSAEQGLSPSNNFLSIVQSTQVKLGHDSLTCQIYTRRIDTKKFYCSKIILFRRLIKLFWSLNTLNSLYKYDQ